MTCLIHDDDDKACIWARHIEGRGFLVEKIRQYRMKAFKSRNATMSPKCWKRKQKKKHKCNFLCKYGGLQFPNCVIKSVLELFFCLLLCLVFEVFLVYSAPRWLYLLLLFSCYHSPCPSIPKGTFVVTATVVSKAEWCMTPAQPLLLSRWLIILSAARHH